MALIGKAGATMAFAGIYLYSPELYPTDIRTVALGTSSMCARISGMIAPYVGGPMVKLFIFYFTELHNFMITGRIPYGET